ncbi:MAG TPA: hypothetical protein DCS07_03205 [Bdellovibrionales bacterium]|nr:hypothetical protein [Bdellovibrionales bacterium]
MAQPAFLLLLTGLLALVFSWPLLAEGFTSIKTRYLFFYSVWLAVVFVMIWLSRHLALEQRGKGKAKPRV